MLTNFITKTVFNQSESSKPNDIIREMRMLLKCYSYTRKERWAWSAKTAAMSFKI